MDEVTVCLGCGRVVGASDGAGCQCPPPSLSPRSSARSPYRDAPESAPCPRCGGRLVDTSFHDVPALDCSECLGLFLDRATIDRLGTVEGRELRVAFPKRARYVEQGPVRYIKCPVCDRLMNRTIFGKMSGVIVDVCKDHGVWFDAGEINAVVDFVEQGGLERAQRKARADHDAEAKSLRAAWQREHDASVRAGGYYGAMHPHGFSAEDTLVLRALSDLFS